MGDLARHGRVAYRLRDGDGPAIIFLPGYASDMAGTKAVALDIWAEARGRALLRFDYSGTGTSGGDFALGTIDRWRDDVVDLIDHVVAGPVVLVGSSLGGWIMLLAALARPDRVAALIGIAAAPDFTDWGFTEAEKMTLLGDGRLEKPSLYGPEPVVTHRAFWQSGEANRLLQRELPIDAPVRLIHGMGDPEVPWHHSPHLAGRLRSADVQTILVKDGGHRLSRPQDIALLLGVIEALPESP